MGNVPGLAAALLLLLWLVVDKVLLWLEVVVVVAVEPDCETIAFA